MFEILFMQSDATREKKISRKDVDSYEMMCEAFEDTHGEFSINFS